jgi:hypothetical protein
LEPGKNRFAGKAQVGLSDIPVYFSNSGTMQKEVLEM